MISARALKDARAVLCCAAAGNSRLLKNVLGIKGETARTKDLPCLKAGVSLSGLTKASDSGIYRLL